MDVSTLAVESPRAKTDIKHAQNHGAATGSTILDGLPNVQLSMRTENAARIIRIYAPILIAALLSSARTLRRRILEYDTLRRRASTPSTPSAPFSPAPLQLFVCQNCAHTTLDPASTPQPLVLQILILSTSTMRRRVSPRRCLLRHTSLQVADGVRTVRLTRLYHPSDLGANVYLPPHRPISFCGHDRRPPRLGRGIPLFIATSICEYIDWKFEGATVVIFHLLFTEGQRLRPARDASPQRHEPRLSSLWSSTSGNEAFRIEESEVPVKSTRFRGPYHQHLHPLEDALLTLPFPNLLVNSSVSGSRWKYSLRVVHTHTPNAWRVLRSCVASERGTGTGDLAGRVLPALRAWRCWMCVLRRTATVLCTSPPTSRWRTRSSDAFSSQSLLIYVVAGPNGPVLFALRASVCGSVGCASSGLCVSPPTSRTLSSDAFIFQSCMIHSVAPESAPAIGVPSRLQRDSGSVIMTIQPVFVYASTMSSSITRQTDTRPRVGWEFMLYPLARASFPVFLLSRLPPDVAERAPLVAFVGFAFSFHAAAPVFLFAFRLLIPCVSRLAPTSRPSRVSHFCFAFPFPPASRTRSHSRVSRSPFGFSFHAAAFAPGPWKLAPRRCMEQYCADAFSFLALIFSSYLSSFHSPPHHLVASSLLLILPLIIIIPQRMHHSLPALGTHYALTDLLSTIPLHLLCTPAPSWLAPPYLPTRLPFAATSPHSTQLYPTLPPDSTSPLLASLAPLTRVM
ncbi:hypothetical protein C8R44DRAFT_895385 [Mycena epipterygia]|nr:hypothetical protein C8R44DRAFT_895385 [Mycena epipterygia]